MIGDQLERWVEVYDRAVSEGTDPEEAVRIADDAYPPAPGNTRYWYAVLCQYRLARSDRIPVRVKVVSRKRALNSEGVQWEADTTCEITHFELWDAPTDGLRLARDELKDGPVRLWKGDMIAVAPGAMDLRFT